MSGKLPNSDGSTARGPRVAKTVTKSVTVSTRAEFTAEELRKRLRLPAGANLKVRVPGGADWSNMDLSLDDVPLVAEWTVTK